MTEDVDKLLFERLWEGLRAAADAYLQELLLPVKLHLRGALEAHLQELFDGGERRAPKAGVRMPPCGRDVITTAAANREVCGGCVGRALSERLATFQADLWESIEALVREPKMLGRTRECHSATPQEPVTAIPPVPSPHRELAKQQGRAPRGSAQRRASQRAARSWPSAGPQRWCRPAGPLLMPSSVDAAGCLEGKLKPEFKAFKARPPEFAADAQPWVNRMVMRPALGADPMGERGRLLEDKVIVPCDGFLRESARASCLLELPWDATRCCLHFLDLCGLGVVAATGRAMCTVAWNDEVWRPRLALGCPSLAYAGIAPTGRSRHWLRQAVRVMRPPRLTDFLFCLEVAQSGMPVFSAAFDLISSHGIIQSTRSENLLRGGVQALRLVPGLQSNSTQIARQLSCDMRVVDRDVGVVAHLENNMVISSPNLPAGACLFGEKGMEFCFTLRDLNHLASLALHLTQGVLGSDDLQAELDAWDALQIAVTVDRSVSAPYGSSLDEQIPCCDLVGKVSFSAFNIANDVEGDGPLTEDLFLRALFPTRVWQQEL